MAALWPQEEGTVTATVLSAEAISRSANQEIPRLLQNPKVHFPVHKRLVLDRILSQTKCVHILISYIFKIHFYVMI
jgi:hypothetical protein